MMERTVTLPKIDIPNALIPKTDILTGGQPTPQQLEQAKQAGYRTIVNLRPPTEMSEWNEEDKARQLGFNYVSIPVAGSSGLTMQNAEKLHAVLENPANYPLIVHCASGNRVGALFALHAAHYEGKTIEEAIRWGKTAGLTGLEAEVRQRLSS
jgi:uncharacterized protein (TIGR01244 family)